MIIPNSTIILLKCPISLDNKNQLTFQNEEEQYNYFIEQPHEILDNATYQRKDNIIRYPDLIDNIINYDYVMYQNENHSNKWFYAFITNMRYVNDSMTEISIITDVWQTWQFDIDIKPSFVEREMIDSDKDLPGANLVPEGFETGEYKAGGTAEIDDLEPWYIVAYAEDTYGFTYNGIYSGIQFYAYSDVGLLRAFLLQIKEAGKDNFILNIFTVPKLAFYPLNTLAQALDKDIKATPREINLVSTPTTLDGYTPKNNKVRTYPYMYVAFNPTGGEGKVYRYEDFSNGTPSFKAISEINPNPTVCFIPQNYRGQNGDSLADIATLNGYPTISWSTDVYNVWLAQNSQLINLKMQNLTDNLGFNQRSCFKRFSRKCNKYSW